LVLEGPVSPCGCKPWGLWVYLSHQTDLTSPTEWDAREDPASTGPDERQPTRQPDPQPTPPNKTARFLWFGCLGSLAQNQQRSVSCIDQSGVLQHQNAKFNLCYCCDDSRRPQRQQKKTAACHCSCDRCERGEWSRLQRQTKLPQAPNQPNTTAEQDNHNAQAPNQLGAN
jgi:hypothetical protein